MRMATTNAIADVCLNVSDRKYGESIQRGHSLMMTFDTDHVQEAGDFRIPTCRIDHRDLLLIYGCGKCCDCPRLGALPRRKAVFRPPTLPSLGFRHDLSFHASASSPPSRGRCLGAPTGDGNGRETGRQSSRKAETLPRIYFSHALQHETSVRHQTETKH
ncbi:uncharacterized protein BDR25DRAFT_393978 [Lindgomyces ingoldianus]|uniref:Uncharacterized protein n=1 Tax=Lindgomyces ingoldianus TaxID=673940 RepID=A0ACB6QSU6_9PLEO|nr:uncharacterized protein BDR25DRAFT_393978 [Lindgomyces ingoldianus]KAF2469950.1 hypothetical protein BDR25DRAFT_393978 [Lindgomyces ingoldianus]